MTGKALPISERRFRLGQGERFMKDAETVRCQARSKSKLLKEFPQKLEDFPDKSSYKKAFNAWLKTLPENAYWPVCQCAWAAEPGTFLCLKHGGRSKGAKKDPLDFLPGTMAEKIKMLRQNPVLLNRSFEIYQLVARNLELYERMGELGAAPSETRRHIWAGLTAIKNGNTVEGSKRIEEALTASDQEDLLYKEILNNMGMLKDMTRTHIQNAKDLQQIVTIDQHVSTLLTISDIIVDVIGKLVHDEYIRDAIIAGIQSRIGGFINARVEGFLPASIEKE